MANKSEAYSFGRRNGTAVIGSGSSNSSSHSNSKADKVVAMAKVSLVVNMFGELKAQIDLIVLALCGIALKMLQVKIYLEHQGNNLNIETKSK